MAEELILIVDDNAQNRKLARDVLAFIDRQLGPNYPWAGNIRELEQCVRSILVRNDYRPTLCPPQEPQDRIAITLSMPPPAARASLDGPG